MTECIQVMTTTDSRENAETIARVLVEGRLAACVQVVGPISSTYWWQGNIERTEEWLCLAKSTERCFDELEQQIRSVHPYDVPEVLALPVTAGSGAYLAWLRRELQEDRT